MVPIHIFKKGLILKLSETWLFTLDNYFYSIALDVFLKISCKFFKVKQIRGVATALSSSLMFSYDSSRRAGVTMTSLSSPF